MIKKIVQSGKKVLEAILIEKTVSVIIFWLIARVYGVERYGEIVTIFTLSGIIDILFQFGFPIYVQRESAKNNENTVSEILKMLYIKIIFFSVYAVIVLIYFYIAHPGIPLFFALVVSVAIWIQGINQLLHAYFYGKLKNDIVLKATISSRVILLLLSSLLIYLKFQLVYILIVFLFSYSIQLMFLGYHYNRELKTAPAQLHFKSKKGVKLIASCFPLSVAMLFSAFYDRIDTVLISLIGSFDQAGYYNVAYSLYKLPLLGLSIIFVPGFSVFAELGKDYLLIKSESIRMLYILVPIGIIGCLFFFFISDRIIPLLYSEAFLPSIKVLKVLSFSFIFIVLNNFTGMLINSLALNKKNITILFWGFTLNILFNLFLIKYYGYIGAAYSTLITELFILIAQYWLIKKHLTNNGLFKWN